MGYMTTERRDTALHGLAKNTLSDNALDEQNILNDEEKRREVSETQQCQPTAATHLVHRKGDNYYCEKDLRVQIETIYRLFLSYFYYPEIGSLGAKQLLKHCAVGTFIVRDSSDHRYLYTISVKTKRGPTSIRIVYDHGRFYFDSDEKSRQQIPKFPTLLDLIDYYVRLSMGEKSERCRFLDKSGKNELPILMVKPKVNDVSSLKHLTRTLINRSLHATKTDEIQTAVGKLPLPKPLKTYIMEYPYLY